MANVKYTLKIRRIKPSDQVDNEEILHYTEKGAGYAIKIDNPNELGIVPVRVLRGML